MHRQYTASQHHIHTLPSQAPSVQANGACHELHTSGPSLGRIHKFVFRFFHIKISIYFFIFIDIFINIFISNPWFLRMFLPLVSLMDMITEPKVLLDLMCQSSQPAWTGLGVHAAMLASSIHLSRSAAKQLCFKLGFEYLKSWQRVHALPGRLLLSATLLTPSFQRHRQ